MKRTIFTYGQLDRVLQELGFACRLLTDPPPARIYDHRETGASIMLPAFPESDFVLEYHLAAARQMLDYFGIADSASFDADLQKAG